MKIEVEIEEVMLGTGDKRAEIEKLEGMKFRALILVVDAKSLTMQLLAVPSDLNPDSHVPMGVVAELSVAYDRAVLGGLVSAAIESAERKEKARSN